MSLVNYTLKNLKAQELKNILVVLFFLLCASCAGEFESSFTAEGNPVSFTSSLEDGLSVTTRHDTWYSMDSVGIYMYPSANTIAQSTDVNKLYRVSASGNSANLLPATTAETIYYPIDPASTVKFTAYYPYKSTVSNNVYPINLASQNTLHRYIRADLLWHQGTTTYNASSSAAQLTFAHQLSKITINLTRSNNLSSSVDLSTATATLGNMPTTGSFSLASGTVSGLGGENIPITTYCKSASTTQAVFEAVIIPHNGSTYTNRIMSFTLGGTTYIYNFPSDHTFTKNNHYTFNFSLYQDEVKLDGTTIIPWSDGGTVDFNSRISVSQPVVYIPRSGTETNPYRLVMYTEDPYSAPTVTYSTSVSTANSSAASYFTVSEPELILYEDDIATYELSLCMKSLASGSRTAYLHISYSNTGYAGQTKIVEVIQDDALNFADVQTEEANCYILGLNPGGIAIPVSRVNTFWQNYGLAAGATNSTPLGTSTAFTTEVVWCDANVEGYPISSHANIANVSVYGTGSSGYIIVQPGTQPGNAVVAIRVGGEIKWSWHIWVTEYDPNVFNKYYTESSGITSILMDRNLGATSAKQSDGAATYGLLYQWGRKDPLPGTQNQHYINSEPYVLRLNSSGTNYESVRLSSSCVSEGTQVYVATSVATPLIFYKRTSSPNDWSTTNPSSGSGLRWDLDKNGKAIDDPCPAGWHVPANGTWNGLTTVNSSWSDTGRTLSTAGFYPAAGYRGSNGSNLYGAGIYGYYWSTTYGTNSYGIYFSSGSIYPSYSSIRVYGESVRCVSDS